MVGMLVRAGPFIDPTTVPLRFVNDIVAPAGPPCIIILPLLTLNPAVMIC